MPIPFSCPYCGNQTLVADQFAGTSGPCAGCGKTITVPSLRTPLAPSSGPRSASSSSSTTVVIIAIAAVCLCAGGPILVALLLPAVQAAREAARRMQCQNNLKQIGLALHNYHDCYGSFPPAYIADDSGRPLHSWRVLILPFIEASPLYDQYRFDEPWDSDNNMAVARQMPSTFQCPSAPSREPTSGLTNYVVIIGDPNQFPQTLFSPNRGIKFADIKDGTSNTIAVVETQTPVPWTQPDADPKFATLTMSVGEDPAGISSFHPMIANVLFADGSVRALSKSLDSNMLRLLIQPADMTPVPNF